MGRTLAILPLLLLLGCTTAAQHRENLRDAGLDLLLRIETEFTLETGLYAGELHDGAPASVARCWPAAVQLAALASAAQVDRFWRARLDGFIANLDAYWVAHEGIGGFNAAPDSQKPDRYYDDNAWMALALLDAHGVSHDPAHLHRAEAAVEFVLSGEDSDGGVWWHEQVKKSKNACSTAPTIVAVLRLYQLTGRQQYRDAAARMYRWANDRLLDSDRLFFDHITVDGQVGQSKFASNTAMMIVANCQWFDITGEAGYLDEARRLGSAAVRSWVDPQSGAIRGDAASAALLAESLLQLYRRDGERRWREIALRAIRFVHERNSDRNGWHPPQWNLEPQAPVASPRLIDQSAAARAMLQAEIVR